MEKAVSTSDKQHTDEQIIEDAWQDWLAEEEEACWVILEKERHPQPAEPAIIYGVIDLSREVR